MLDIQDYSAKIPTGFLVLPCVTINRHERDTEILAEVHERVDALEGDRPEALLELLMAEYRR